MTGYVSGWINCQILGHFLSPNVSLPSTAGVFQHLRSGEPVMVPGDAIDRIC